jgi:manganese/zinc/iron transport system permease protein
MRAILLLVSIVALELAVFAWAGIEPIQLALQSTASATYIPYNTLVVLLGTGTLGLASGVVGAFAVLRRRSLVGDAVAHSALPGLAIAFMLSGERHFAFMLVGALVAGLIGGFLITWLQQNTRIKADAAIGIVLSVLFGLGIVLSRIVQDDPSGRQAGLDSFLLGKTAGMISQDLLLISIVALNAIAIVALLYKEFKVISFDPHFASAEGLPVLFLDSLLMGLLVVITVIGLPAVGVVLMAALLIIPGVSARFWTDRLHRMIWLAGLFGLLTGAAGTYLSGDRADRYRGLRPFGVYSTPTRHTLAADSSRQNRSACGRPKFVAHAIRNRRTER